MLYDCVYSLGKLFNGTSFIRSMPKRHRIECDSLKRYPVSYRHSCHLPEERRTLPTLVQTASLTSNTVFESFAYDTMDRTDRRIHSKRSQYTNTGLGK